MLQAEFDIVSSGPISLAFIDKNINTFSQASLFIKQLPYGRNVDKNNSSTIFTDYCGTCSTKHALLKQLADENNFKKIKLFIGLFAMNKINTPAISVTLSKNNLNYIPEAHCYLKFDDQILDCTKTNSHPNDFINDLIEELEIAPDQITDFKVNYHKRYLLNWLKENKQLNLTLEQLWNIREQCIEDLFQ